MKSSTKKVCGRCGEKYLDTLIRGYVDSLLSGLCPDCIKKIEYYVDIPETNIEYCDSCGNKLGIQKIFYDGRKICPICYTMRLNENQPNKINYKCPKCGYKE